MLKAKPPKITPGDFLADSTGSVSPGPAGAIYAEALWQCRAAVSNLVASGEVNELPNASSAMVRVVGEKSIKALLHDAIRNQLNWSYVGSSLLDLYGIEQPDDESLPNASKWQGPLLAEVDHRFSEDLLAQIEDIDIDTSILVNAMKHYNSTRLPEFADIRTRIKNNGEEAQDDVAVDGLFDLAKTMFFSPDFTLPDDKAGSAYILCYLPRSVRILLKDIVTVNQVFQRMEARVGSIDGDGKRMLETFRKASFAHALTGQYWSSICKTHGVSDRVELEMVNLKIQEFEAQLEMEELIRTPGGLSVIEAYDDCRYELKEEVEQFASTDKFGVMRNTDIGHGLHGFKIHPAVMANIRGDREIEKLSKTGGKAIIYEDDVAQAGTWRNVIEQHSSYEYAQTSDTADLVLEAQQDRGDIGLYVIDIDNPEGEIAGIELAEKLLLEELNRHNRRKLQTGIVGSLPVRIVLWSSSEKLLEKAASHFKSYKAANLGGADVGFMINMSGSMGRKLSFVISTKDPAVLTIRI